MSGAAFSDVDSYGELKELYSEDAQYQEHILNSTYEKIKKASEDEVEYDGKSFNVTCKLQLNESYAAIVDGERLPDSDVIKSVFAKYYPKQMYAVLEATQFAMTRGHNKGRVSGKYLDDLIKSTLLAFMSGLDFDCLGNGRGYRAKVDTVTAGQSSFKVVSSMRIRPGMKFDWYDSTYATKRGSIKVDLKSVDRMNRQVYIDASFGTGQVPANAVLGDVLVVYGALAAGEPTDGRYLTGLASMTDNSKALGTLNPSSYAQWQSVNQNLSGGNISQEALQVQLDSMFQISGRYPNRMLFATPQKRSYLAPFLNQRRFNSNNFDTGATSVTFDAYKMGEDAKNKKPSEMLMIEDKNMDPDVWYFWVHDCLMIGTDYGSEPRIANEDGSDLRYRLGYDSMQGFYRFWANMLTNQRNCLGKIYGLAIPSGTL